MKHDESVKKKFIAAVDRMNKVLKEAKTIWPDAEYYLANSTLNLMSGQHHEGNQALARQDRVLASKKLHHSDGGDW